MGQSAEAGNLKEYSVALLAFNHLQSMLSFAIGVGCLKYRSSQLRHFQAQKLSAAPHYLQDEVPPPYTSF